MGEYDRKDAEQKAKVHVPGAMEVLAYEEITVEQAQIIGLLGGEIRELGNRQ